MSGLELAGFVLGAYPILLETAKDLREVIKDVKTWWHFEREFENFLAAVETEHITYSLNLQILLEDLDISEEDKKSLEKDSTASGWHDARTQAKLRRRIQNDYYAWFMRQLAAMDRALGELQSLLSIVKMEYMNFSSLEREKFRLKTSFTHRKNDLLAEIRDLNKKIFAFLGRASHLSGSTTPRNPLPRPERKQTTPFLTLQGEVTVLYEAFHTHLCCKCTNSHSCGIAVSRVDRGQDHAVAVHLNMLFLDGPCRTQVKILSIPATDINTTAPPKETEDKLEDVSPLHQQLSTKNRFKAVRKNSPKAIFALAASSILALGSLTLGKPRKGSETPQDQPKAPLRIRWSPGLSKQDKMESVSGKSVATMQTSTDSSSKPNAQISTDEGTAAIHDLCQAIKPPMRPIDDVNIPKLGYLVSKARSRLLLNPDPENQVLLQSYKVESLETFVKATPRRDARLKVGCDLAFAILGLGTSPWIPASWTAEDLLIIRDPAASIPKPYFNHASLRSSLSNKETRSSAMQTRASLFALGVLLLELVFGNQLKNQQFRGAMMGEDMKPNATTDLATALLWQQKVEEQLGNVLADAIKRCLVCMFEQASTPDLRNSKFVQAVRDQVIKPIETFVSAWNGN